MERISQAELLNRVMASVVAEIHTSQPGVIESYDRINQVADIKPVVQLAGEELPVLPNIPVIWPRGGDGYLHLPLDAGDTGLIVSCEVDVGTWRARGQAGNPGDNGRHELAFSVFVPGLVASGDTLNTASGATILGGSDVRLGGDSAVEKVILGESNRDAITTWAAAVSTAFSTLTPPVDISAATTTLTTQLNAALSGSVKVKS